MSVNGQNERIKREYARYLRDACGFSEPTVDKELAALASFEVYTRHRDFSAFRNRQASGFKEQLATSRGKRTRESLSDSTQVHTLSALRRFFTWLADQEGYRGRIKRSDADYFRPGRRQAAIARTVRSHEGPTIEQVIHVLDALPYETDIQKRDRALIAFTLLTGVRDNALASLRLKHVDIERRVVVQDAREVRTKASKTIETWFFPVGAGVEKIVADWIAFLKQNRLWGLDDPVFPKTRVALDKDGRFSPYGLDRGFWSNATSIRAVFKRDFERAGLPYFNPHSLRKTLARLGQTKCQTPEEFKAWSQNLGHDKVMTTLTSYGTVDRLRQRDLILGLSDSRARG